LVEKGKPKYTKKGGVFILRGRGRESNKGTTNLAKMLSGEENDPKNLYH